MANLAGERRDRPSEGSLPEARRPAKGHQQAGATPKSVPCTPGAERRTRKGGGFEPKAKATPHREMATLTEQSNGWAAKLSQRKFKEQNASGSNGP